MGFKKRTVSGKAVSVHKCVIFDVADSQVARQVVNQACNVPGKWDMF